MSDEIGRTIPVGLYIAQVSLGDGAAMSVLDPRSFEDGGLEWKLRYGDPYSVRMVAASIVSDYDALTSGEMTIEETVRRLYILRKARAKLAGRGDE